MVSTTRQLAMVSPRIDAILFDADGVIQRAPADIHQRLATSLGAAPHQVQACVADIFEAEAPALVGAAELAETLAPVLARWRAPCDAQALIAQWHTIEVDTSVLGLVAELRAAGMRCAIASNQEAGRARRMSDGLGYGRAFDREFYSCHVGHAKPSPHFFAEVIRQGGLDPPRTLFIDDRPDNVEAARRAGLVGAQFVLGEIGSGAGPLRALLAGHGVRLR
jgi:putative hydrolase of the HAD superfamily